jgi:hypothetical protein
MGLDVKWMAWPGKNNEFPVDRNTGTPVLYMYSYVIYVRRSRVCITMPGAQPPVGESAGSYAAYARIPADRTDKRCKHALLGGALFAIIVAGAWTTIPASFTLCHRA